MKNIEPKRVPFDFWRENKWQSILTTQDYERDTDTAAVDENVYTR